MAPAESGERGLRQGPAQDSEGADHALDTVVFPQEWGSIKIEIMMLARVDLVRRSTRKDSLIEKALFQMT